MSHQRSECVALNADVVGYSRLVADDIGAVTTAMVECRQIVERLVGENDGTLVNFVGDNFMAVFGNAMDAVRASIAITKEIEAANASSPDARRIRFRMGLDQGEVAVAGGEYFGDALNIAARVQAMARPGGISVSGRVYTALDEPALRFHALGHHRLKGIPEEVAVYEFADLPDAGATPLTAAALALESPSVAVLPMHAAMADEPVREMARVLRRDLVHRLSRIPQLEVIDVKDDPDATGKPVAARYMIESGVHQAGDTVRVYASVFDVTTMNVVKSHKRTAKVADLFDLSDSFTDEVGRAIEVDLVVGEPAGLYADLGDPEAIEQVYLGWYQLTAGTPEAWGRAVEHFTRVARSHPEQPYGHVLLAFANWTGATNGWTRDAEATLRTAREQARAGLAIGDPTGMAQTVEAAVLMSQGRGKEALDAIEKVEILRPTCDVTYGLEGSVRRFLGQWERAVDLTDTAMRLTGVNKPWYPTVQACSLFMGGKVEQAAVVAEMVLEHQEQNLEALLVLTAAQLELGLERRARATAELVRERYPSVDIEAWLEANPYQSREMLDRWRSDLVAAGAIPAERARK